MQVLVEVAQSGAGQIQPQGANFVVEPFIACGGPRLPP